MKRLFFAPTGRRLVDVRRVAMVLLTALLTMTAQTTWSQAKEPDLPKGTDEEGDYLSALPYHPDVIITRDKKGFNDLGILVMTPAEFVNKAKQQ